MHLTHSENRIVSGLRARHLLMFALLLFAAAALALALSGLITVGVSVTVGGEELGTLASRDQADRVVAQVEQQVSAVLGEDYSLAEQVETGLTLTLRKDLTNPAAVRGRLLAGVEEVTNLYALTVNGELIGASADRELLQELVETCRLTYGEDGELIGDVNIYYTMVPTATAREPEQITAALWERVSVRTVRTAWFTETVSYGITLVPDDTMYIGETRVVSDGIPGKISYSAEITYRNDLAMGRTVSEATLVKEPVDKVIAYGTAERPATASTGTFIWPAEGILTSYFGPRSRDNHAGIDIAGKSGSDILAADGGLVICAEDRGDGYGNLIIVELDDGTHVYYGHCLYLLVSEGERVSQGQVIAAMGSTGLSTGTHLHFEVRIDNVPTDPLPLLP